MWPWGNTGLFSAIPGTAAAQVKASSSHGALLLAYQEPRGVKAIGTIIWGSGKCHRAGLSVAKLCEKEKSTRVLPAQV